MSYWGCATFPNTFLGSRADVTKLVSSPHSSVQSFRDLNQKSFSTATNIIRTSNQSYKSDVPVEAVSELIGETFLVRSLGLEATSVVYASSGSSVTQEQKAKATNDNYVRAVLSNLLQTQVGSSTSIILPVQVAPDMYYWVRFEEIDEDKDTTAFE